MKKILIGSFFLLFFACYAGVDRPSLYCFYTPQFQLLYEEYFLPSLKDDFEIVVKEFEQECPTGSFRSDGWDKTMYRKLQMLREAILSHWNQDPFFYSDIDIICLKPIVNLSLKHLADRDFVAQQGWPKKKLCAGFIVMKGNERTLKLIDTALDLMEKKVCVDDQTALWIALEKFPIEGLTWDLLPPLEFPNGKRVLKNYKKGNRESFLDDSEIELDDSIVLFHANCCIGLQNKINFLTRVQMEYTTKRNE